MNFQEILRGRGEQITFLVGENGCGKSTLLASLAQSRPQGLSQALTISNTVYDRFPRRADSYSRLAALHGKSLPSVVLKKALLFGQQSRERSTEKIAKILSYLGFEPRIGIRVQRRTASGENIGWHVFGNITGEQIDNVERALAALPSFDGQDGIIWLDVYSYGYQHRSMAVLDIVEHERVLKKSGVIKGISLHLVKHGQTIELSKASSGELTLLSLYAFLSNKLESDHLICIDEPENSLHPHWQHEYCARLLDMFHYYSPRIMIATHSPLIVSGAQSHGLNCAILQVEGREVQWRSQERGIEGTLYESFQTLSPQNHYLSERIADMLERLNNGKISIETLNNEIDVLYSRSYDEKQQAFLNGVRRLAEEILADATESSVRRGMND